MVFGPQGIPYQIGTVRDDTINLKSSTDVLNAGAGNDTVNVAVLGQGRLLKGAVVIDGDVGTNTLSYANGGVPLTVTLQNEGHWNLRYKIELGSIGVTDYAYNFQTLKLSGNGDKIRWGSNFSPSNVNTAVALTIEEHPSTPSALNTVDFSQAKGSYTHNNGSVAASPFTFSGFSTVIGSSGGNDIFNISSSGTESSFTRYVSGNSSNTFNVSYSSSSAAPLLLMGNAQGGDTFNFANADKANFTVVWGGTGGNTYNFEADASAHVSIIELDMAGVSYDELQRLDLSKLEAYVRGNYSGFPDLRSTQSFEGSTTPAIVILNPGATDTITYDGERLVSPQLSLQSEYQSSAHYSQTFALGQSGFADFIDQLPPSSRPYVDPALLALTLLRKDYSGSTTTNDTPATLTTYWASIRPGGFSVDNFQQGDFGVTIPHVFSEVTDTTSQGDLIQTASYDDVFNSTPRQPVLSLKDYLLPSTEGGNGGAPGGSGTNSDSSNVSAFLANQAALNAGVGGFSIADTAANVSAQLDALNADANINSIVLTDNGDPVLTLTATQAMVDGAALGAITNANYEIAISDRAAAVSAAFDLLAANAKVSSIGLTDSGTPILALSAAQALDDAGALAKITNVSYTVAVSDTATNVASHIDVLNADARIGSITLTDGGSPTLSLTVAQVLADTAALAAITNAGYAIAIRGSVADILANQTPLGASAHVGSTNVVDSAANIVANRAALDADAQITTMTVIDTAANILANSAVLDADPRVTAKVVIDTAANVVALGTGSMPVQVSDTAANVAANIDALNAATSLTSITLTDSGTPSLMLTVAQALGDTTALAKIANATYVVAISDTAANISANIDALDTYAPLGAITLTDSSTSTLVLTVDQALGDTVALNAIANTSYAIAVAGTAADVSTSIDALNSDARLSSITLTDSGPAVLTLTASQTLGDTAAFAKIANPAYTIAVSDNAGNFGQFRRLERRSGDRFYHADGQRDADSSFDRGTGARRYDCPGEDRQRKLCHLGRRLRHQPSGQCQCPGRQRPCDVSRCRRYRRQHPGQRRRACERELPIRHRRRHSG
jgi:hypothetical protein